jgi:hypothetical protein
MTTCEVVAERVAVGEPLGELAAHVATCAACTRLTALPALLGATRHATAADPGPGFAARITGAAQRRLVVRRQRRIATVLGTAVAAAAALALAVTQLPTHTDSTVAASEPPVPRPAPAPSPSPRPAPTPTPPAPTPAPAPVAPSPHVHDAEVAALVRFARVDHSRRLSANWARITAPLAPYRSLVARQGDSK